MKNEQEISQWLNSGEYQTQIDTLLTKIIRESELSKNESDTSSVFENELYFLIRRELGIEIKFQKETPLNGITHTFGTLKNRTSGQGRLDALINNLVIEYKHHSKLRGENAIKQAYAQVKDYLTAIKEKQGEKYDAILTDGIKIAYFSYVGDEIKYTNLKTLTVDDIDRIIEAILNNQKKKFEPINIVNDFSISPISISESKDIAKILFKELTENITDKTKMLYEEWKSLMHLSVNDNGKSSDIEKRQNDLSEIFDYTIYDTESEYKSLFALQTTYAIIVKLIACKVVDNLNFNSDTDVYHDLTKLNSRKLQIFFQNMEDGYSYSSMGIRNFLEGDFFSWYADESQWNEPFYQKIKTIVSKIDLYSAFSLNVAYAPIDIFKDLYMSIIPQSIRHSMGEYYTPEWLADRVISNAVNIASNSSWKAIDPCCGSGIFIITLIKKVVGKNSITLMSREQKKNLLDEILQRVHGIDINPLSVLSARVSYYLAIRPFGEIKEIEIPVYLGDSAIIPVSIKVDGIDCYSYSVSNLKCDSFNVVLPKRFVHTPQFGRTMSKLQSMVKTDNENLLFDIIVNELSDKEKESDKLLELIRTLAKSLVFLHSNSWDGIWIRISTNFMLIARLREFDMIVGNPPWVKWEHLPQIYTRKIKEFCDIRHIFCNDGMFGGAQLNICALISNVTASNWLKPAGILAFLMPDSIMSQNSYEEFRNFYIDYHKKKRLYLQTLDKWVAPLRPFKVGKKSVTQDFNTYYFGPQKVDYKKGVHINIIGKKKGVSDFVINQSRDFEEAKQYLQISSGEVKQLSKDSTAFTYISSEYDYTSIIGNTAYLYRTGVESTPFEVFKLRSEGPSEKKGNYRFKNKILKTSKYKVEDVPADGWDFPVKYIYPMIEGPCIKPFEYDYDNNFHIVPYDESNTSKPVPIDKLYEDSQELAIYFADHKYILDMQSEKSKTMHRGDEFYSLSKIGQYTFAPFIVAARDNSKFCSSVIKETRTPWGEMKKSICVKHTIIISQDISKNYITEDEAHYINGILNSTIVRSYIHSTFKTNGFSLNKSHLFIPKFDPTDNLFTSIAELSKKATLQEEKREEIKEQLSDAYIALCNKKNTHKK